MHMLIHQATGPFSAQRHVPCWALRGKVSAHVGSAFAVQGLGVHAVARLLLLMFPAVSLS